MPDDVKSKLEGRIKEVEGEFTKLDEREKALIEQGKGINQELSTIRNRKVHLQGAFAEVKALLDDPKEIPVEEPAKAKKK